MRKFNKIVSTLLLGLMVAGCDVEALPKDYEETYRNNVGCDGCMCLGQRSVQSEKPLQLGETSGWRRCGRGSARRG